MENPFRNIVKKTGKIIKTAGLGLALTATPLEAVTQNTNTPIKEKEKISAVPDKQESKDSTENIIVVHDKNDPRLKAYEDSLAVYNLTNGTNFDDIYEKITNELHNEGLNDERKYKSGNLNVNAPRRDIGYLGSKIKYTKTKTLPKTFFDVRDWYKEYDKYKPGPIYVLLHKIKPIGFYNQEEYSNDFITSTFSNQDPNETIIDPATDFIEETVNKKLIKKFFPLATDAIIDKKIKWARDNPVYAIRGSKINERNNTGNLGSSTEYKGKMHEFTKKDIKQESIVDNCYTYKSSIPIYKKPTTKVIYEDPKAKKDSIPKNISITKPKVVEHLNTYDSNLWGYSGDNKVVGYYNKGDGKGRIDVSIDDLRKMDDIEFKKIFPNAGSSRKNIIEIYDVKQKINNSFTEK